MLENRFRLLPRDAGEPVEEVVQPGAGLEVLEERLDGDAGAAEDPRSAPPRRGAVDRGAVRGVKHRGVSPGEGRWAGGGLWVLIPGVDVVLRVDVANLL